MVKPTLDDPIARQYADIIAVHGYDLDGITAASPDAQTVANDVRLGRCVP
jgi:hypothetical protein